MEILLSVIGRNWETKHRKEQNRLFISLERLKKILHAWDKQRTFELTQVNNNNRVGRESREKLLGSKTNKQTNIQDIDNKREESSGIK